MSRDFRQELIEELIGEVRRSQSATQTFDHAVAQLLGLNHTDFRCVDVIQRRGRTTAGDLARESGLTTGAVTAVIDRLERAGYARRVPDPSDRRRVLVEITPKLERRAEQYYGPIAAMGYEAFESYSDEQLELLRDFHRTSREINERMVAELHARHRREHPPAA